MGLSTRSHWVMQTISAKREKEAICTGEELTGKRIENMKAKKRNSQYVINFGLSILVERINGAKNPKGLDNPHIRLPDYVLLTLTFRSVETLPHLGRGRDKDPLLLEAAEPQGSCGASRGAGGLLGPQCRATARPETRHLALVPGRGPALRGRRQQRLAVGSGRGCRRRVPAAARRGWRALRAARRLRGARGARGARLAGRSRRAGIRTSEIKMSHTSVQQNFPATSVAGEQHLSGTAVRIPRAPPTAPSDLRETKSELRNLNGPTHVHSRIHLLEDRDFST
ncbi:uncharacterized protein LOC134738449 [Pongo pygmaeus]|uniref:uncharacterized protein LOC134738449 n=1 Tax=Pongo pygmaeus TaxID=9600 RepID=UPI00300D7F1C